MKRNRLLLLLVWGTFLLVLLLISGLPNLAIAPNRLLDLEFVSEAADLVGYEAMVRIILLMGLPLIFIVGLIILPLLRSRNTMIALLVIGLLILFLMWITSTLPAAELIEVTPTPPVQMTEQEEVIEEDAPQEELSPIDPVPLVPSWVSNLVTVGMVILIIAVTTFIIWYFWPREELTFNPLQEISQEAEEALTDLRSGTNLRNVVLRCYLEMSHIVDDWRGIRRQQSMTPREFETTLAELGLPKEPVINLTRLFEAVRYGTDDPSPEEEETAESSLTSIVQACREQS